MVTYGVLMLSCIGCGCLGLLFGLMFRANGRDKDE